MAGDDEEGDGGFVGFGLVQVVEAEDVVGGAVGG